MAKYEVFIENAEGVCEKELFKKMARNGDISAVKVEEMIEKPITLLGYAECSISTDNKEFDLIYYATDIGYISSGSQFLLNSIKDYLDDTRKFVINKIKTKKGITYKASPIIEE